MGLRQIELGFSSFFVTFLAKFDGFSALHGTLKNHQLSQNIDKNEETPR